MLCCHSAPIESSRPAPCSRGFGPSSRPVGTTMASADFSRAFPHRCRCAVSRFIGTAPETSQGKPYILPSVPAGFTYARVRVTIGPPRLWPGYPTALVFYPVPVRRVRVLPSASFRFHLTMDTLAWASGSGHHGPQRTFSSKMHNMPGTPIRPLPSQWQRASPKGQSTRLARKPATGVRWLVPRALSAY